jgi:hypothetical protein
MSPQKATQPQSRSKAAKRAPATRNDSSTDETANAVSDGAVEIIDTDPQPSSDEIARLAYSYWEARAGVGGSAEEDWLRAECELKGVRH